MPAAQYRSMRIGFSTLWLIVAAACAPAQRLAPTSASLQAFLDTCPQNDPYYAVFQRDLPILRNGVVSSNFPCVEPYTAMTVGQVTDELVILQAVRMAYYMDMGRSDYLPWTPFRLYDWMKQRVAGFNIDSTQAGNSSACCTLIQGRLYIVMGPMSTATRGASLSIDGLASQVTLLAHETRHSDS